MKYLKIAFILAFVATVNIGCDKIQESQPPAYCYSINISFTDKMGNDLVAPLGKDRWHPNNVDTYWTGAINPDKYTLDYVFPNPEPQIERPGLIEPDYKGPAFWMAKSDDKYQLTSDFHEQYTEGEGKWYLMTGVASSQSYPQESTTFRMVCPTIFGDNSVHELVTYWVYDTVIPYTPEVPVSAEQFPECASGTFDGNTIDVINIKRDGLHVNIVFIDVVLDID